MSRSLRSTPELVVAGAIGGGLIVWVIVVFGTVLLTGAGTGDFLDPYRALGRVLTTGSTWLISAGGAVVGGAVGAIIGSRHNKKK